MEKNKIDISAVIEGKEIRSINFQMSESNILDLEVLIEYLKMLCNGNGESS